uniref:DUF3778 domain-containing protein n=1 Tax=Oryza glaberrima TaxID=4538 RepID=I1P000_ORYGL
GSRRPRTAPSLASSALPLVVSASAAAPSTRPAELLPWWVASSPQLLHPLLRKRLGGSTLLVAHGVSLVSVRSSRLMWIGFDLLYGRERRGGE